MVGHHASGVVDTTVDELAPLPDALNAQRIHGFELVAAVQRLFATGPQPVRALSAASRQRLRPAYGTRKFFHELALCVRRASACWLRRQSGRRSPWRRTIASSR